MIKRLFIWLSCCLATTVIFAQRPSLPVSNLRVRQLQVVSDTLQLDTLSIIPNTVHVQGIEDSTFGVDWVTARFWWISKPETDTFTIRYRTFGLKWNAVAQHLNFDSVRNNFLLTHAAIYNQGGGVATDNFFNFGNITYNGSFGRGISFGNSQDAVFTSNLNLQLNGYLADSIQISAAITDNNIPIQPDGTTQQLNEFDRIYLEFRKPTWKLALGDIDLRQDRNYFLSFYKRLQGAAFETTTKITPAITNTSLLSGSIAKGKYTRQELQPLEGNQGPYRLQGANNEFFFVVLAGTEKVFIDGELMQRGEDQDYVINYNTAEITFTPKRLISRDRRIQVEFEYADRNYLNSNLFFSNETVFGKKLIVRFAAFSNNDVKNSPINQTLDPNEKKFLNNIGDSVSRAFYPVATLDTFSANKILYKRIDTLYNNGTQHDSIYVFSVNPDSAKYSLSFLDVGQGNGNYIQDFNGANGKVFGWVAPQNGIKQGNFEPSTFLVTPKRQRLLTIGADYRITTNTLVSGEVAMSDYDVNTFSTRDKGNDQGRAIKLGAENTKRVGKDGLKWVNRGAFEHEDASFKPLERLRNVEFTRDWTLPILVTPAKETYFSYSSQLTNNSSKNIVYQFSGYKRGADFNGTRNSIVQQQDLWGFRLNNQVSYTKSTSDLDHAFFFRPAIDISRQLRKLGNTLVGVGYSLEDNEKRLYKTDSMVLTSFSFRTYQAYLKSDPSKANKWSVTWSNRENKFPIGKSLVRTDKSQNIGVGTELLKNANQQFRLSVTYRDLKVFQPLIINQKSDHSLLGRAEYNLRAMRGFFTGNVLYEIGSGQEQRRDYAYLEVPAGQGEYTWIDYNKDGVQQLNEFEVALFQDQAKYIRILTPTNQYIKADYTSFNYSVSINPRAIFNPTKVHGIKRFLTRFNMQSSMQVFKKEISSGKTQFNPFRVPLSDTSLISLTSIISNSFSFNRYSTKWGFDLSNNRNTNKALITYGLEGRLLDEWNLRLRWNLGRSILVDVIGRQMENNLQSESVKFSNRNYSISGYSVEPRITYTHGTNFRVLTGYKLGDKHNRIDSMQHYSSTGFNTEIRYTILQSSSIQGKFTYTNIKYPFATNSTLSYVMLEGLLPGKNFLWNLNLSKRLSNNLEINLEYEGRKPGTARPVHIGRASVRALL